MWITSVSKIVKNPQAIEDPRHTYPCLLYTSASILVYIKGKGVVLKEPSVVAIDRDSNKIMAIGEEARLMIGRTPGNIVAVRPLRQGVISDYTCLLYTSERNKVMKINERWEELKEESNRNIQSEEGILKRQTRSIQTEGHFGDIKENENFRRFNYRSKEKVYKEFMLYAIGRNIMK